MEVGLALMLIINQQMKCFLLFWLGIRRIRLFQAARKCRKLYVEFPQVQYIDLSGTAHVVWAVVIVTSARIKLSTFFMVSDFLSAV